MPEKIIGIKKLSSRVTAKVIETKNGVKIEIGAGTVFLSEDDIYPFVLLMKEVDRYFIKKR